MTSRLHSAVARTVEEHLSAGTFPACSVCVFHRGTLVLDAAWGVAHPDVHPRQPATPGLLFDLASLTKLVTATALLALVSAGHTTLHTRLADVLPAFGVGGPRAVDGGQDPHSKQPLPTPAERANQHVDPAHATLWHLLTHTSGLPPWRAAYAAAGPPPAPPGQPEPLTREARWAHALALLCATPFVADPAERVVRYSDVGFMLLGEAVTRVAGASDLASALHTLVVAPLAGAGAPLRFAPCQPPNALPQQATAPTEDDPAWRGRRVWGEVHDENACGVGGVAGHAGLFGTARAVAAFGQAWLDDARTFGIDAALARQATSLQAETDGTRRGLGWALKAARDSMAGDLASARAYGHSGFTGTSLWIDPDAGWVVAALTNSVYAGRHVNPNATHAFRRALHDAIAEALV